MLYLGCFEVEKMYYMDDNYKIDIITHIIEADNEDEANDKVIRYYAMKDVPYYVTYLVNKVYINEIIQ